jgi:hypothetical protein
MEGGQMAKLQTRILGELRAIWVDDRFCYWKHMYSSELLKSSFRDTSAWYHFVLAVDTTQATAANRFRFG